MFINAEYAGGKSSKFIKLSVKSGGIQLKSPDKIGCLSVPSKITHFTHFTYKFYKQLKILGHGDDKGRLHMWLKNKKTRQAIKPEP